MDALAGQIMDVLCGTADPLIEQLQVESEMLFNPSPPSIDIYPDETFTAALAFGPGNREFFFKVRARVSTADSEGGQDLLKSMMDPRDVTSVELAIISDDTLGGVVEQAKVTEQSGFGLFSSIDPDGGNLLGCTWTVRVIP